MKKSSLKIFTFLMVFTALFSCNSDRETVEQNNYFKVDGGVINVIDRANASLSVQGDRNVASFIFTSFNRQKTGSDGSKTVQLGIDFPVTENINGTYTLNSNARRVQMYSTWYTDFDGQHGYGEGDPTEATITVTENSASSYNVVFSFITSSNKKITGQYNGNVVIQ